jgi:predicted metal-dependent HD superfamily phosphohydrolase
METALITKAKAFAEATFNNAVFDRLTYHNLEHTQAVVRAAEIVGRESDLSDDEMESVLVAAWLHDIGYVNGGADHEAAAAEMAQQLLSEWGAPARKAMEVADAIRATRMPQQPHTMVSKVLCDADLYQLSQPDHLKHSHKLREELESQKGESIPEEEWLRTTLEFLQSHQYHTPYGKTVLEREKKKNIKELRKALGDPLPEDKRIEELEGELVRLKARLERQKSLKPDRGIETMFRTTSHNHILLSDMADNKANILITINSIILSIVVSVLVRKVEENMDLVIPTIILLTVCLTTMVAAILAIRPNTSTGKFAREDIKNKRTNLLFFGNFYGMEIETYEWAMKEMMKDGNYLYGSLIKDIYYLGKVLGRKYKYLRLAYNIFMFGFVAAILSFVVAMLL